MAAKTNAARILDNLHIHYELHSYEVGEDHQGAEHTARKLGIPPEQLFKTIVARGDRSGVLIACVPSTCEMQLKALAALSGNKRVALAPLQEVQPLTGYVRGGVSPVGCKTAFPVYLDESALRFPWISVSAGARGLQMFLDPRELCRAVNATTGSIAAQRADEPAQ